MRRLLRITTVGMLCLLNWGYCQEREPANPPAGGLPSREPFTLKLRDKGRDYEQRFDQRIPFVEDSNVYLFGGEEFGVNLKTDGDAVAEVSYQPDKSRADVWFAFVQEKGLAGGRGMMLITENKLKRWLHMEALMSVPRQTGTYKTSILPVGAGMTNGESWPHPIVKLTLLHFSLSDKPSVKSGK